MIGNNELILNQATMIQAVQMWIDAQMKEGAAPKVTAIKVKNEPYDSVLFVVALGEKEAP